MAVNNNFHVLKTGFFSSILLSFITLITFALAMTAIPISGPWCQANCIEYPYHNSLQNYPHDYYWMFLAMVQLIIYIVFMISLHYVTSAERKMFSFTAVAFALLSALLLMADYFIQFAVVPVSLMMGETEGIALLTQYNPHGIFIAMEELGYLLMSLSFFCLLPVFHGKNGLERTLRWLLALPFILNLLALVTITAKFGIVREYWFEIITISINWLFILALGVLVARLFKMKMREAKQSS
ncbi:MAG: hypothetical protein U0T82_10840 [Bacteroidales bacterium]